MDTKKLCELTSAADSLQLKPLVDLTSRALARIIEGKTPEEIRETFHLPDDLTEVMLSFIWLILNIWFRLEKLLNAPLNSQSELTSLVILFFTFW